MIENQFITVGEWNFGSAISMIMAVIIMISMYVTRRLDKGDDSVRAKTGRECAMKNSKLPEDSSSAV